MHRMQGRLACCLGVHICVGQAHLCIAAGMRIGLGMKLGTAVAARGRSVIHGRVCTVGMHTYRPVCCSPAVWHTCCTKGTPAA